MSARRTGIAARRWLGLAVASLVVAAFAVIGVAAPASAAPADTIYALVNQARAAQGLRGFLRNQGMDAVSSAWAGQMGASGTMSHNPDYASQIPGGWSRAGENVAAGYPTAQAMFDGWMKSPGHRANILGDFTDIGIAFISVNGQTWGVQDFGKYPGHVGPAAPPPAAPAPAVPVPAPAPVVPTTAPVPSVAPSPSPPATVPSPGATAPSAASGAPATVDSDSARPAADISGALAVLVASCLVVVLAVGLLLSLWRRRARAGDGKPGASRGSQTRVQDVD